MRPFAGLVGLLSIATFFEGFDTSLAALVMPALGAEFDATTEELGTVLGISSIGMMLAFFAIHLADWLGRRPVFLGALLAFAALTLATAQAPNLVAFTICQLFAKMAMVVQLALAYVILSEELPPQIRGRANGLLGGVASVGAAIPAALLAPLESVGLGWRGLFLIGAAPLLLLPLYWRRLPETRAYASQAARRFSFAEEWAFFRELVSPGRRRRFGGIVVLWLTINFWSGTALYFFMVFVFSERGWTSANLLWLPLGTIPFGFAGYALSGFAMDRFGRKKAAGLYLVAGFVATAAAYQIDHPVALYLGWFCLIGLGGVWTVTMTWTAELFPTHLRATALGTTNNLIGRFGLVIGPIAAGQLSAAWGETGHAITLLAGVNLLCLPVVFWILPETRGVDLIESEAPSGTPATD